MNLMTIFRLLATALNPTTTAAEAKAAIQKAHNLGQSDGTIASVVGSLDHQIQATQKLKEQLRVKEAEVEALQEQNSLLGEEVDSLRTEVAILTTENSAVKAATSDTGRTYAPFGLFAEHARLRFGRKTWKSAFAFDVGITVKEINAWKTVDLVPAEWAATLDRLSHEERKAASRQPWTDDERARLRELLEHGFSDLAAAQLLTGELGRRLLEPTITGQRRRLSKEGGWVARTRQAPANGHAGYTSFQ